MLSMPRMMLRVMPGPYMPRMIFICTPRLTIRAKPAHTRLRGGMSQPEDGRLPPVAHVYPSANAALPGTGRHMAVMNTASRLCSRGVSPRQKAALYGQKAALEP